MFTDATEPIQVGKFTARVVYDEDPTPPWDWDWGATAIDPDTGRNLATGARVLRECWGDFHEDFREAVVATVPDVLAIRTVGLGRSYDRYTVYVTKADMDMTGAPDAHALLDDCIELLRMYVEGECYGYVVEDESGEVVDSCWGIYTEDVDVYPMDEAVEIAQSLAADAAEEVRRSYLTAYDRAVRALVAS